MSFLLWVLVFARKMSVALCFFIFFSMGNAQAITIDFDDLEPGSFLVGDGFTPPLNQIGSVIFEGYVQPISGSTKSGPNFLLGSTLGFAIYFIDTPPTYVSMYVGSLFELKVGIRVKGVNGYLEDRLTDGGVIGMNWETSTPYRPDQFVSFYVPEGISYVSVGSKMAPYIDDFTFIADVPEPSAFILLWLGLLMIWLRQKRLQ